MYYFVCFCFEVLQLQPQSLGPIQMPNAQQVEAPIQVGVSPAPQEGAPQGAPPQPLGVSNAMVRIIVDPSVFI